MNLFKLKNKKIEDLLTVAKTHKEKHEKQIKVIRENFVIAKEFDQAYINLTSLLSKPELKNYRNLFRENESLAKVKFSKQILYEPKTKATFIGTFVDQYIQSKLSANYIDNVLQHISPWKKDIWEYIVKLKAKDMNRWTYLDYAFLTYSIEDYRAGLFSDVPRLKIKEILNNKFTDKDFEDDFDILIKIIDTQLKKYDFKEVVINPTFGSKKSGVKADGDLIINNKLTEIKCSIDSSLKWDYMRQLAGYKILNDFLETPYKIDGFIYWNPLYDIFYEFKMDVDKLETEFNNGRIWLCNQYYLHTLLSKDRDMLYQYDKLISDINSKKFSYKQLLENHKVTRILIK